MPHRPQHSLALSVLRGTQGCFHGLPRRQKAGAGDLPSYPQRSTDIHTHGCEAHVHWSGRSHVRSSSVSPYQRTCSACTRMSTAAPFKVILMKSLQQFDPNVRWERLLKRARSQTKGHFPRRRACFLRFSVRYPRARVSAPLCSRPRTYARTLLSPPILAAASLLREGESC